jgi:hypothetical protein
VRMCVARAAMLAAASALLAGCGGDDDPFASYCEEVEAQRPAVSEDLAAGGGTGLIDALPEFQKLAAKAPDDIQDEWDTVTSRIGDLVSALEDADVDPATYDRKRPPDGLTPEEKDAIDAAAQALVTPEMTEALNGVEQQARDVCKTPLTL